MSTAPRHPCLPLFTEAPRRRGPPVSLPPARLTPQAVKVSGVTAILYTTKGGMIILYSTTATDSVTILLPPL